MTVRSRSNRIKTVADVEVDTVFFSEFLLHVNVRLRKRWHIHTHIERRGLLNAKSADFPKKTCIVQHNQAFANISRACGVILVALI